MMTTVKRSDENSTSGCAISALTWLEPIDQADRCRQLDRLDAALSGADHMAGVLGQTSMDYAGQITALRNAIRNERHVLLAELEDAK